MIDHDLLKEICGDDEDFIREILTLFLTAYEASLEEIRRAVEGGDTSCIERSAHTFKGMVSNITTDKPLVLAQELVTMARSGNIEMARDTFAALEKNTDALVTEIKKWLAKNPL